MISTMRERLSAKLGNNNDNAFKMRKLFKMYDKKEVGMVSSDLYLADRDSISQCSWVVLCEVQLVKDAYG
jgi:hypothetical protein